MLRAVAHLTEIDDVIHRARFQLIYDMLQIQLPTYTFGIPLCNNQIDILLLRDRIGQSERLSVRRRVDRFARYIAAIQLEGFFFDVVDHPHGMIRLAQGFDDLLP